VRFCPSNQADSCECKGQSTKLDITCTHATDSVAVGTTATYPLVITNNGPDTATEVAFSVETAAGLRIDSIEGEGIPCDVDDANVDLCHLGNISAGARVQLVVRGTLTAPGASRVIFSVAHHEADVDPARNSVAITTYGRDER
jgi:hypothetical protein